MKMALAASMLVGTDLYLTTTHMSSFSLPAGRPVYSLEVRLQSPRWSKMPICTGTMGEEGGREKFLRGVTKSCSSFHRPKQHQELIRPALL